MKIRKRLALNHSMLILLSLCAIVFNSLVLVTLADDSTIINEAGRLRALSFSMSNTTRALQLPEGPSETAALQDGLRADIERFDDVILLLKNERHFQSYRPAAEGLTDLTGTWNESFKPYYLAILSEAGDPAVPSYLPGDVEAFVDEINTMVSGYANHSRATMLRGLFINAALIFALMAVAVYAAVTTNRQVRRPISLLIDELRESADTDAEAARQVQYLGVNELAEMSAYMDLMLQDELTGVLNRRGGIAKLRRLNPYDAVSLCFLDIDGLKEVNDTLGHAYGDELMITVAAAAKEAIDDDAFVVRLGGDEFLIAMPGSSAFEADQVKQRINSRFDKINSEDNRPYIISVSIGIAEFANAGEIELEEMLQTADERMYVEKKRCREQEYPSVIREKSVSGGLL